MNMDVIDEPVQVRCSKKAKAAMRVTSVVKHTLVRVWSPVIRKQELGYSLYSILFFCKVPAYPPTVQQPSFGPLTIAEWTMTSLL